MEQSLLLWMTPEAEEGADADELEGDVHDMPPYEFRINASKILLELNQIDTALEVLDQLLAEDDTIMQVSIGQRVQNGDRPRNTLLCLAAL